MSLPNKINVDLLNKKEKNLMNINSLSKFI